MCGIAGVVTADRTQPAQSLLDALRHALDHRGPDGGGHYAAPGLGLVQTRLAIIDLTSGDQPLYGPQATALVANGEIYNYLELKEAWGAEKFATKSDCEVPIFAYVRDGDDFTRSLRGMYAIALADQGDHTVRLARDPFGIKPLYYARIANGILFASEPQALLKTGLIGRRIRREAAGEFLQLQFTTGRHTIFTGIERVMPGETIVIRDGDIAGRHLHPSLPQERPAKLGEAEALKRLDAVLMDSVAMHQRSDVPYGMFLSGGVDSSIVLACMARLNQKPVVAFTAGFPGSGARDERRHAESVAKAAGAEHVNVEVTAKDFWTRLPAVAAAMDDPAADYAALPTYILAEEAGKNLKVVLTGEGGDELFAGYSRYRSFIRPRWLGGRAMRRRGIVDGFDLLRETGHWRDGLASVEQRLHREGLTQLQKAQALDCADWLPNDLLLKLDRCLMAHGVEGRTPFLDSAVADFAYLLPDALKVAGGQGKYLLRRWLEIVLPAANPFEKKRGFTVPVAEWIRPRAHELAPLMAKSEGIAEICFPDKVESLFRAFGKSSGRREGAACWQLLFYALWHAIHVRDRSGQDDIFGVLEA